MSGGMSHMDTFDPKPGTETGGATKGISTGVAGIELAEFMPQLAKRFSDVGRDPFHVTEDGRSPWWGVLDAD